MSSSAIQSALAPKARLEEKVVPTPEDLEVTRLIVAVHGIGNQFRYSTVQAVACRFATYCGRPITQPLGAFHPIKLITKPDSPELGAYLFEPPAGFEKDFSGFGFAEVFWADIPERAAATKNQKIPRKNRRLGRGRLWSECVCSIKAALVSPI